MGVGRMGDDSGRPPLERRAPKASLASPVSMSRPELPEALLQRMQAVVNAAHAQAVKEDEAQREHAESDTDPFLPRLTHSESIEERAARAERERAAEAAWAERELAAQAEQERKTFETTLAGSLQIVASSQAHSQLVGGQVDARLGTLIEGMASELPQPVRIMEFGNLGPGASVGVPLRSATLVGSVATLRSTLAFALAQNDPHHPARAEITRLDGRQVLFVEFTAPSPLGLFNPTGS